MRQITINGKKRKLRATIGAIKKIIIKYDFQNENKEWSSGEMLVFLCEVVWRFLKPKFIFYKPYLFYFIFKNRIDIEELRKSETVIFNMLYGIELDESEGKEQGKEKKGPRK